MATTTTTLQMAVGDVEADEGLQVRVALDERALQDFTAALLEGAKFPPIRVYNTGGAALVVDGFHRLEAHRRAKMDEIAVELVNGNRRDALLEAIKANRAATSVRITNADKARAVRLALLDPEVQTMTDKAIADLVGVTHPTVARVRATIPHQPRGPSSKGIDHLPRLAGGPGHEKSHTYGSCEKFSHERQVAETSPSSKEHGDAVRASPWYPGDPEDPPYRVPGFAPPEDEPAPTPAPQPPSTTPTLPLPERRERRVRKDGTTYTMPKRQKPTAPPSGGASPAATDAPPVKPVEALDVLRVRLDDVERVRRGRNADEVRVRVSRTWDACRALRKTLDELDADEAPVVAERFVLELAAMNRDPGIVAWELRAIISKLNRLLPAMEQQLTQYRDSDDAEKEDA